MKKLYNGWQHYVYKRWVDKTAKQSSASTETVQCSYFVVPASPSI